MLRHAQDPCRPFHLPCAPPGPNPPSRLQPTRQDQDHPCRRRRARQDLDLLFRQVVDSPHRHPGQSPLCRTEEQHQQPLLRDPGLLSHRLSRSRKRKKRPKNCASKRRQSARPSFARRRRKCDGQQKVHQQVGLERAELRCRPRTPERWKLALPLESEVRAETMPAVSAASPWSQHSTRTTFWRAPLGNCRIGSSRRSSEFRLSGP
mmetsp:Transcript_17629/g.49901  ORF Transcript_17629/g.49901 Transcript_17629/m.49901 type:complete len:206 (-) Transcript_17629:7070-7687(-)